jgi:hypothetical protein
MTPFPLAVVQLEYAEWLFEAARADDATPLLATALATFEGLEATPWVERAKARDVAPRAPVPA